MFKLINGIYYSQHKLEVDNDALIKDIIDQRNNPKDSTGKGRPNQSEVDVQHTFYEDTPLSNESLEMMEYATQEVVDSIFGSNTFSIGEIWGHIVPPGEQTMIHNHEEENSPGLSFVYYPHMPENTGNLVFITNLDRNRILYEINSTAGHLYIFSRDILHFTPRNGSNEDRISCSGNFTAKIPFIKSLDYDIDYKNPYWLYSGREGTNK